MLVLTRQKLPIFDRSQFAPAEGLKRGAYLLFEGNKKADIILIATGSEVHLVLEASVQLKKEKINASVVSMPSWELFRKQDKRYRDKVLPPEIKARIAVEAASPQGWLEWVGDEGKVIGISEFGSSAPYEDLYKHYKITVKNIVNTAKKILMK
jgi:transketolase